MEQKVVKRRFFERLHKYTRQEKIFLPISHVVLFILALWSLLPMFFALINSVKTVDAYYANPLSISFDFQWSNYKNAFELSYRNTNVLGMLFNSVIFVITFSFGQLFFSIFTAYALSRFNFLGKGVLYAMAVVIQIIPIFGATGASYLLMDKLNLIDNIWMIWISGASGFGYTFLIMFSYFENVDRAYAEAAYIDGAGRWRTMLQIIVPMIMPAVLTMWLSSFVTLWNDYTTALIYLPNHPTLSTGLYNLKSTASFVQGGKTTYFAALIISMIPVLALFSLTQRKIFKIDVNGGVKG